MRHAPTLGLIVAGLALGAHWRTACAAQWSIEPTLGWLVNYDSNPQLLESGAQATAGTTLSADATLKRATEITELDLRPHLDLQRFASDAALNSDNGSLQGSFTARAERSSLALTSGYEHTSTLTTELSDTGIIDAAVYRDTTSAGLSLTHALGERQHLDLEGSYANVVFPGGEQLGLVGYRYPSASLSDTIGTSEVTSISATAFTDRLSAPLVGYDSRDTGARLGVSYAHSARLSAGASAGVVETTVADYTQHGYVWDLHATRSGELDQWTVSLNRTVQPSGRGFLLLREAASLSFSESVAPQLFVTGTLQYIRNSNLASGPFFDVPRYESADAGLEWHPTEHLVLSLTAGVREIREPTSDATPRGWHTAFNTRWAPRAPSVSR